MKKYFEIKDSPWYHSDKIVTLKRDKIWKDTCKCHFLNLSVKLIIRQFMV